jgi:hypothetical protein
VRWTTTLLYLAMAMGCSGGRPPPPPPHLAATPLGSVHELESREAGTWAVVAYVIQIHVCQPCPGPAPCVPCAPEGLSVSDHPPTAPGTAAGPRVVLRTDRPDQYEGGGRYRFVIEPRQVGGARELRVLGASEAP